MLRKKIIINVFSNWTNFIVLIGIAFFVSPILVQNLGNENYGIWTLIVSLTGYFTVLDFGVNTAIVRFISMYVAQKNTEKANEIYSTSFVFFFGVSVVLIIITAIFAAFFKKIFNITSFSNTYLYFIFFVVGADLALGLLFSVLSGTLTALQEFVKINIISISISIVKNIILVIMLLSGYKLMTLAIVHISVNTSRYFIQHIIIRKNYGFLHFQLKSCKASTLKQIYDYSIYSFIISIALKLLFYTDSIVIGSLISVSMVVFFAIPSMIFDYITKFLWAMIGVLIPVISSNEALNEIDTNRNLYIIGTKYTLAMCLPILFVLFTVGDDFITLWMGNEYGLRSEMVLRILLSSHVFFFSQLIAHAILKGISRHKFLAYFLIFEAVANLAISLLLARPYGIEGVAVGTAIPMVVANIIAVPVYTCRQLNLQLMTYYREGFLRHFLFLAVLLGIYYISPIRIFNYLKLGVYSLSVAAIYFAFSLIFILERGHRGWIIGRMRSWAKV